MRYVPAGLYKFVDDECDAWLSIKCSHIISGHVPIKPCVETSHEELIELLLSFVVLDVFDDESLQPHVVDVSVVKVDVGHRVHCLVCVLNLPKHGLL